MQKRISLSGEWEFRLDENKQGIEDKFYLERFKDTIQLPGTTALAKKGEKNQSIKTDALTEEYPFEGYAWYRKTFIIEKEEQDCEAILMLERTRISYVWIDGNFVGKNDSLCTSHAYKLSPFFSKEKQHSLTIMVSNTDYPIPGGHMTSPDTQTNWNGILGSIAIHYYNNICIKNYQIFASYDKRQIDVVIELDYNGLKNDLEMYVKCTQIKKKQVIIAKKWQEKYNAHQAFLQIKIDIPQEVDIEQWNEFSPTLYEFALEIKTIDGKDELKCRIGFRDLKKDERTIYLNQLPLLIRGKHDGMLFPLTGFAPMEKTKWKKIFKKMKTYGINHYRFHTCCPPKAAFLAADEEGIYLEPELPFWGSILCPDDAEYKKEVNDYLKEEGMKILKEFGNHPSFLFFSLGNELWGSQDMIRDMLQSFKAYDSRHFYTQGSNNFQFSPNILEEEDFFCGVRLGENRLFRGSYAMCDAPQGHIQVSAPENQSNYDKMIRPKEKIEVDEVEKEIQIQFHTQTKTVQVKGQKDLIPQIPVISHEIGQYAMYPDYDEISKYVGVLRADNLSYFREKGKENGLLNYFKKFFYASGQLAVQCYKRELETAYRSKELAGFQILDLQDFQGQGSAIVGILDAHLDNKGLIKPSQWRQFCFEQVLMLSFEKYVLCSKEWFDFAIMYTNMRFTDKKKIDIEVKMKRKDTNRIIEMKKISCAWEQNRLKEVGRYRLEMPKVEKPLTIKMEIKIIGTKIKNCYELYVFPKPIQEVCDEIVVTDNIDELISLAKEGKRILFIGNSLAATAAQDIEYCTDFWCYSMFKNISESMHKKLPIGTLGLYIENKHPAFNHFPCECYSTPQWWNLIKDTKAVILDPNKIKPIVCAIDNVERSHLLGVIYEANIQNSKVIICQCDLLNNTSVEANALYHSLINYMKSDQFQPESTFTEEELHNFYG